MIDLFDIRCLLFFCARRAIFNYYVDLRQITIQRSSIGLDCYARCCD